MTSDASQKARRRTVRRATRVVLAMPVLALFGLVLLLAGGSSRADAMPLVLLRPAAILALMLLLLLPLERSVLRRLAVPLTLLAALAVLIVLQLVPLPPELWLALPGHARFAPAIALGSDPGAWRPLSVAPERTLSSLLLLLVPLTVFIGYAAVPEKVRGWTLPLLIAAGLASALLGVAQMLAGTSGWLYIYQTRDTGLPTGLFANRNHQAVFLAMLLPALRAWIQVDAPVLSSARTLRSPRALIGGAAALFLVATILVTQSRAGFAVMLVGLLATMLAEAREGIGRRRRTLLLAAGVAAAVAAVVALTLWIGRETAAVRLIVGGDADTIGRLAYVPTVIEMIRAAFPLGYGFGSFDPVFRSFEPLALLKPTYVNNAHNDLLELAATGGVPALAILAAFLVWTAQRGAAVFARASTAVWPAARAAAIMIAILLLASLVDYPLRTPLMAGVLALLVSWLAVPASANVDARG